MLKTNQVMKSLSLAALALIAAACGSKVAGTYTLSSISGSGGMSAYYQQYCSGVVLNVQSGGNNLVTAAGTSGQCSVSLTGTENSGTVTVSQFSINITNMSSYGTQCTYTGTMTVNNNILTGTLTGTSTGNSGYSYGNTYNTCGTVTLNGTKSN